MWQVTVLWPRDHAPCSTHPMFPDPRPSALSSHPRHYFCFIMQQIPTLSYYQQPIVASHVILEHKTAKHHHLNIYWSEMCILYSVCDYIFILKLEIR